MQFNSTLFIFLVLPVTVIVHSLIKKPRLQNLWLLLVSILFFGWGNSIGIIFIAAYALINYGIVRLVASSKKRKLWTVIGVIADVCVLFLYKYLGFTVSVFNDITGSALTVANFAQPMGISFLTFTTIAYIVDVYKKDAEPLGNFFDFLFYLSFFPKAAQGPITKINGFSGSIGARIICAEDIVCGLKRFIVGFAKKCLIADVLGATVDAIFSNLSVGISSATAWVGILCYTLQIFYDFSGYTDMAIGIAYMLGFKLPENFNAPYRSTSISEFWRRWHMTLGQWFREYIYIPLGGNRKGVLRTFINLGIVWLITGIWHGAAFTYILWGVYYGIIIIIEKSLSNKSFYKKVPKFLKWAFTFLIIMIGWVMFRSSSLSEIMQYFAAMVNTTASQNVLFGLEYYIDVPSVLTVALGVIFLLPYPKFATRLEKRPFFRYASDALLILIFIISIVYMVNSGYESFIYFQF